MTDFERAKRFREARTKKNQHGAQTLMEVAEATGISISTLSTLENPEHSRVPSSKNVNILAQHYGVNPGWLLGQSISPSTDLNTQMITDYTGLSADAIEIIRSLPRDEIDRRLVNAFIESEEFAKLLCTAKVIRDPGTGEIAEKKPVVDYAQAMNDAGNSSDLLIFSERDREELILWKAQRLAEQMIRKAVEKVTDHN